MKTAHNAQKCTYRVLLCVKLVFDLKFGMFIVVLNEAHF